MKRLAIILVLLLLSMAASAFAAEDPFGSAVKGALDTFTEGCKKELTTFCKGVVPGESRVLACLYAHQDKLSPRCEYALYDSAAQLDRAVNAFTYAASECQDDLESYCAEIEPGGGRLRECLKKNEAKVSDRCKTALKDVGAE